MEFLEIGRRIVREAGEMLLNRIDTPFDVKTKDSEFDLVTEMDKEIEKVITSNLLKQFPDHQVLGEEGMYSAPNKDNFLEKISSEPFIWVLDPIDGTTNYVHQLPGYTISMALFCFGEIKLGIIYNPANDEMFWAERGKGAYLNGAKIHVSTRQTLSESVLATGFPTEVEISRDAVLKGINKLGPLCRNIRVFGSAALHCAYVAAGRLEAYWEPGVNVWDVAAGAIIVNEAGGTVSQTDGTPFDLHFKDLLCSNSRVHLEMINYLITNVDK